MPDIRYYSDKLNIELSSQQLQQFDTYMKMVIRKNEVMNLTAITDPDEFALKHFADSLSIVNIPGMKDKLLSGDISLIDVGTGAGFPGIPLKLAFPDINLTLLDSLNKRIRFLDEVLETLGIKAETIHSRAEDGARKKELRDSFDLVVSRAVANLSTLSEYCLPYAKVGGTFISYKSGNVDEELKASKGAIHLLGGSLRDVIYTELVDCDIERSFVLIDKKTPTPKAYPRKAGTASKSPLS